MGVRHFRIDCMWKDCNPAPGVWDYDWLNPTMEKIAAVHGTALLVLYGTPQHMEPSWPRIPEWSGPPAIPIQRPAFIPDWQQHISNVASRWPWASMNIATETTLPELWADPDHPSRNGGAQRYVDLVLRPASEVLKPLGCRIVSPGTTMREEDWLEALSHVGIFMQHADLYTQLDLHVYRDTGRDTVSVLRRLLQTIEQEIEISESGFANSDVAQLRNWQAVWDFLMFDQASERITKYYAYQWWSGPAGLLREDGSRRPAAEELARRLQQ